MKLAIIPSIVVIALLGISAHAQTNVGLSGTAIMGYTPDEFADIGDTQSTGTFHAGGEGVGNVNDGNLSTYVDDFGNLAAYSYVGVDFSVPLVAPVTSLNLYMYTFGDGGWFGVSGTGYNQGELDSTNLIAPIVQVTYDQNTWVTVGSSNTYVLDLTGVGPGQYAPETTFALTSPVTGIEGIRLLGPNGGTATDQGNQGFIGVAELQVISAPEPSTYALVLLGASGLAFFARRKLA